MPGVFDDERQDLAAERARLQELTTADEYRAVRRTTRNAHYTDARYAALIWDALGRLGFTEGRVLEPGCGSGNFIGLAPDGATMTGVERDPTTAAIAAHLYPNADIRAESFADTRIPAMYFDGAVGNVPFGRTKLSDPAHNPGRRLSMHNHFIVKSLELTRPGGMVALVTSRYTMDARNPEARRRIAALGDLVAAIRLPDGAHRRAAGTDVVTDLLILRRRDPAQPGEPDGWEMAQETNLPGGAARVNEYFAAHPEFVLGEMKVGRGAHGENDVIVTGPADASAALAAALETAVTRARASGLTVTERPESAGPVPLPPLAPSDDQIEGLIQAHPDGTFTRLASGAPYPYEPPATQATELRQLIGLRDTVLALLRAEAASPDDTEEINGLRATLNEDYTAYLGRYGPVKRFTWAATGKAGPATGQKTQSKRRPPQGRFRDDPLYPLVDALEESYDPVTKTAVRADIFTQRVVVPETPMLGADTPDEALAICLNKHGEIRLEEIARLLGASEAEARAELGTLVFDEPGTGQLIWAPLYLSGDVRAKLTAASGAAEADPGFEANVAALREVVPRDLGPAEIEAQLGAGWIAPHYVQQFLCETLGDTSVTVERSRGRKWKVSGGIRKSVAATSTWGTRDACAQDIAQRLLTGTAEQITVKRDAVGGGKVTDHEATEAARQKARELADRFSIWVWEDTARTRDLCRVYNDRYNAVVPVSFDGVRLFTPGLSSALTLHAHQPPAIARVIYQGSAGLVHGTGAGKTLETIIGVRERQRLGLSHKPCFVVQKNKVGDFRDEFLRAYPDARLLVADTKDLTGNKRREFIARCATGNPTAIIMSREAFRSIPVSAERLAAFLKEEEIALEIAIEDARKSGEDERTVKQIEAELENTRERRKEQAARIGQDSGLTYEDTGIDYLVLDEARAYRKGPVISALPGMADAGSARSLDLLLKLGYHHDLYGETRVCLADATPFTNKISEIYNWLRYLHYDIEPFDDWVRTFGKMAVAYEMVPGGDFKAKARLREVINAVDLHLHLRERNDFKLEDSLDLKLPVMTGGKPQIVQAPAADEALAYFDGIRWRYEHLPKGPPKKGADNHLKVLGDFLKASLDLRLVGRTTSQPQKVDVTADVVYDKWVTHRDNVYKRRDGTEHPVKGGLILVFASLGTPGRTRTLKEGEEPGPYDDWNFYDQLRANLADRGMPAHLIKFMHEADGNPQRLEQLFHDARNGAVHVLVGSTEKLGVGVNVQDRAVGLVQVTAPWNWDEPHQELGRVRRLFNQNEEFFCIRIVTSPSADAIKWERARQKELSFRALMTGEIDGRTIRIPDDDLSSAEVMAAASGDPRMLERAEMEGTLSRLDRLYRAWKQNQTALGYTISDAEGRIAGRKRAVTMIDTALGRRKDTRGDAFAMTIDGQRYTKRTEAAGRLREILLQRIAAVDRYQVERDIPLGEIGGFTLTARLAPQFENSITLTLEGIPDHPSPLALNHRELPEKTGIITRLENRIAGLEQARADAEAAIVTLGGEIAEARASLGGAFPQQAEYDQTSERLQALEADLASTSKPVAGRQTDSEAAAPAPSGPQASPQQAPGSRAVDPDGDAHPRQVPTAGPPQAARQDTGQPAALRESAAETGITEGAAASADVGSQAEARAVSAESASGAAPAAPREPVGEEDQVVGPASGSAPAEGLVIEHSQQGTLVRGTDKNDHPLRRLLHQHGFKWSGNLEAWYLPRPWNFGTRDRRVSGLTAGLREANRPFTVRAPSAAGEAASDPAPEPLPPGQPYAHLREAREDHFQAIHDYWALTRTPAGHNVMSTYGPGARPGARVLDAAYHAVGVSWEKSFAGDPQQVAERLTAWARAATVLARSLAAEQHRAPKFRETLDTFIRSATQLASRTQATAQDPAEWARVFAELPASAPSADPDPEAVTSAQPADSSPQPGAAVPSGEQQDHGGDGDRQSAETVEAAADPPGHADPARQDPWEPTALTLTAARETAARHGLEVRIHRVGGQSYITFCEPAAVGTPLLSYPAGSASARHGPVTVPVAAIGSYLAAYRESVPPAMFSVAEPRDWGRRVAPLTPHLIDGSGHFIAAARDRLRAALDAARDDRLAEADRLLSEAEALTPVTLAPEREAELTTAVRRYTARYGHTEDPAAYLATASPPVLDASDRELEWVRTYIASHPEIREHPAADEPAADPGRDREAAADIARRAKEALDSGDHQRALALIDEAELVYPNRGVSYDAARDQVRAAMSKTGPGNPQDRQHAQAQAPAADEHAGASTTAAAAPGGYYEARIAGPPWDSVTWAATAEGQASAEAHARSRSARSSDLWEVRHVPGVPDAAPTVISRYRSGFLQLDDTALQPAAAMAVPPPAAAAQPLEGTQPLAEHTRWAGNLRPERLLYADGTPLTIRGQGEDADQALPATAVGIIPAPADSDYGPGRLQVVRWEDGRYEAVHPALASPADTDPYDGLSDRDRARWEAFDHAEAWPTTTAGLLPHLVDPGDVLQVERGPRSRTMDLLEIDSIELGAGPYADGLEFRVKGRKSPLFYLGGQLVPVRIPLDHPALEAAVQAAPAVGPAHEQAQAATAGSDVTAGAFDGSPDTAVPGQAAVRDQDVAHAPTVRVEQPASTTQAKSTLEKYTRPDGTLAPERQGLHDEIVEHVLAGHQPQAHPVATFFGGGSASGKSALTADTPDNVRIDADSIKEMLPEYKEMLRTGDARAAAYAHEESSALAKRIEGEAQRRRYNYILDGTGDTSFEKMAAKVAGARAAGYGAVGKYVTVDTDTAVDRARKRAEKTGRMVPESVIRAIHASVSDTFAQAADERLFDALELLDNNEAGNRKVIARDDSTGLRLLDLAAYDRFLAKGEEGGYAREHRGAGSTPPASEAGEIGLSATRSAGHATRPGTVGRDRPGPGQHAGAGPGSPRPLGLQRGLTSQQPSDPASNPLEPPRVTPGTGGQAGEGQPGGLATETDGTEPAEAPVNNSDLAIALRRLPGFTQLLTQAGTPPRVGSRGWRETEVPDAGARQDLDYGPSGIEITIRGSSFRRHGLVAWPQVASWIDAGVTPARLGIIITADRLSKFCRTRHDELAAAGKCDPDAARAELDKMRDDTINTVVNAALRTRGAAAPVPPSSPGSPAYYTIAMIIRPDEAASRAENKVLERLNQLRTQIREPQPITPQEVKATIQRWIGDGLPDYARALGHPDKMRAWITRQARGPASRPSRVTYATPGVPGGRWYGASPEGLLTAVGSDDRAETLIPWEEIPAWVQPGITSSLLGRLTAAADARTVLTRRRLTAAVHPAAKLQGPSDQEEKESSQRLREAIADAWAAIADAIPPAPAQLEAARRAYRDNGPVQDSLFDDLPQQARRDGTRTRASAVAPAGSQPGPAPSGSRRHADAPSLQPLAVPAEPGGQADALEPVPPGTATAGHAGTEETLPAIPAAKSASANPSPAQDDTSPTEEDTMPAEPAASVAEAAPQVTEQAPAPSPAPPAGETTGRASAESGPSQARPASQPSDGSDLLGELDRVLDAIIERRRGPVRQDGTARDDFTDIRAAFTLLRGALDIGGPAGSAMGYAPYPVFTATPRPAPGQGRGTASRVGEFDDIRSAFADLRRVLDLPAGGRHARGSATPPGQPDSRMLDRAAEEAQACARWYRDAPEWQRISAIGRATRQLITTIRDAAKDYWAEIRQDIRVRGFARTLASRVCLAVSGTARLLAGGLERAGRRDTRMWRAAWGLHRATATYADRIMRYTPPQRPDRMTDARRIIEDLDSRQRPARASGGTRAERAPDPVRLARASFTAGAPRPGPTSAAEPVHRAAPAAGQLRRAGHRA